MKRPSHTGSRSVSLTRRGLTLLPAYLAGGALLHDITFGAPAAVQAAPDSLSATQGSVGFSVAGGLAAGSYADGPVWIQVTDGARMHEPTPVQSVDGASVIHGAQVNPRLTGTQGYDGRSTGFAPYAAELAQKSWPLPVAPGDVIVKVKSKIPAPERARDGLPEEIAACFIVSAPPPPGAFSPAVIGWPGRGVPQPHVIDIATRVAALPSLSTRGHTVPSYARIMARLDHYNPLYAQGAAQAPEFYSQFMVNATTEGYNYGKKIAVTIADGLKAMISDRFTPPQKQAIATRILSMGLNWYDTFRNNRVYLDENGGILQFHFAAMALALAWTGRSAALAELGDPAMFAGNFGQAIRITDADMETFAPHDSNTRPYPWRRRKVAQVYGRTVTVPEISPGEAGDPASNCIFDGMALTRESDGATATVTATGYPNDGTYVLKISAHPQPPFAPSDVVFCAPPQAVIPAPGEYDWCLSGRRHFSHYSPMPGAAYRNLNTWGGQLFCLRAMGIWDPAWTTAWRYVVRANTANTPSIRFDHPTHNETPWDQEMWRDHIQRID